MDKDRCPKPAAWLPLVSAIVHLTLSQLLSITQNHFNIFLNLQHQSYLNLLHKHCLHLTQNCTPSAMPFSARVPKQQYIRPNGALRRLLHAILAPLRWPQTSPTHFTSLPAQHMLYIRSTFACTNPEFPVRIVPGMKRNILKYLKENRSQACPCLTRNHCRRTPRNSLGYVYWGFRGYFRDTDKSSISRCGVQNNVGLLGSTVDASLGDHLTFKSLISPDCEHMAGERWISYVHSFAGKWSRLAG